MTEPAAKRSAQADDRRTDRELVYAARDGDMLAFDALFYRYRDGIFRLGLAITKDPSHAEEIAVDTLGPKHRIVVVLHYMNGLNLAEIAQVVDCPIGTVKSRLHYALRRLRTHLSAHPEFGIEPLTLLAPTRGRTVAPVVEPVQGETR